MPDNAVHTQITTLTTSSSPAWRLRLQHLPSARSSPLLTDSMPVKEHVLLSLRAFRDPFNTYLPYKLASYDVLARSALLSLQAGIRVAVLQGRDGDEKGGILPRL